MFGFFRFLTPKIFKNFIKTNLHSNLEFHKGKLLTFIILKVMEYIVILNLKLKNLRKRKM